MPEPGIAMVLGPPYAQLWLPPGAFEDQRLLFVEQDRWSTGTPLRLDVPADIAQAWMPTWTEVRGGLTVN